MADLLPWTSQSSQPWQLQSFGNIPIPNNVPQQAPLRMGVANSANISIPNNAYVPQPQPQIQQVQQTPQIQPPSYSPQYQAPNFASPFNFSPQVSQAPRVPQIQQPQTPQAAPQLSQVDTTVQSPLRTNEFKAFNDLVGQYNQLSNSGDRAKYMTDINNIATNGSGDYQLAAKDIQSKLNPSLLDKIGQGIIDNSGFNAIKTLGTGLGAALAYNTNQNVQNQVSNDPNSAAQLQGYTDPRNIVPAAIGTAMTLATPGLAKQGAGTLTGLLAKDTLIPTLQRMGIGGVLGGITMPAITAGTEALGSGLATGTPTVNMNNVRDSILPGALFGAALGGKGTKTISEKLQQNAHDNLIQSNPNYKAINDQTTLISSNIKQAIDQGAKPQDLAPAISKVQDNLNTMQSIRSSELQRGSIRVPGKEPVPSQPVEPNPPKPLPTTPETLYRGVTSSEWNDIKNGGVSANKKTGRAFVGTADDAQMILEAHQRSGKSGNVVIEYKPSAKDKLVSGGNIGENTGGNLPGEYQAKGLGMDDIAKVTDENGKIIYKSSPNITQVKPITVEEVNPNGSKSGDSQTVEFPIQSKIDEYRTTKADMASRGSGYSSGKSDIVIKDASGNELDRIPYDKAVERWGTTDKTMLSNKLVNGDIVPSKPSLKVSMTPEQEVAKIYKRANTSRNGKLTITEENRINQLQSTPTTPKTEVPKAQIPKLNEAPKTPTVTQKVLASKQKQVEDALGGSVIKTAQTKAETLRVKQPVKEQQAPSNLDKQKLSTSQEIPVAQRKSLNDLSSSSNTSPNKIKDTLNTPLSKVLGDMTSQAPERLPTFNAVAGAKGTNSTRRLSEAINTNPYIAKAAKQTKQTGHTMEFFAKKDAGGRSVGVEPFNSKTQTIESGFVVDKQGNILGNHIKVDETGIQVNVGGDLVNIEKIIGNPGDWKGKYRVGETMSRNIDSNAPGGKDGPIARQTKDYLIGSKVKSEANFRTELGAEYKNLGDRIKATAKAKPSDVSTKAYHDDIFSVLNGDKTLASLKSKYDTTSFNAIKTYSTETRTLYNSLLKRVNSERVKFGQQPIEPRKDYITHLQEMNGNKSFTGEVINSMRNSFSDDGMQTTRGSVPGSIAGRTETFKPVSAYNKFLQHRTGTKSLRDPFKAVQEYLEPALYNIHMTEAAVRARAVESAFRTAGELKTLSGTNVIDYTGNLLKPYKSSLENSKMVAGFQEFANALGKKTQRWDRQIIDASNGSALALKSWQKLQKISGQATIGGNVSSILAQPLNTVTAIADAGPRNFMKGIARTIGGDKAIDQSSFIKARFAKDVAPIRSVGQKITDAGFVPLQKVENESIKLIWNSQHAKAQQAGFKGKDAILQADYGTERIVAGRGIADKPELYRSTVANGFLQYTLEVAAQNKVFWKDLSPKQKLTFVVAAYGMNQLYSATTGTTPLPDFLGAAIDTTASFVDPNNKKSVGEKSLDGAKRFAGEAVGMSPIGAATANIFLTPQNKKDLFGNQSDMGRYPGTAAPIRVIQNAFAAGKSATQGNFIDARNNALKTIPFGNQAQKTLTGVEANVKGYAVDKSGKPTFGVSNSPVKQAQNVLFGPNSSAEAKNYYNSNMSSFSKNQTNLINSVPASQQKSAFDQIYQKKLQAIADNKQLAGLSSSPSNPVKLNSGNMAYQDSKGIWKVATPLNTKLDTSSPSYGFLTESAHITNRAAWSSQPVNSKYQGLVDTFNNTLPAGMPKLPSTNAVAQIYATNQKNAADNNWSPLQTNAENKKTIVAAYKTQLTSNESFIASMSDSSILSAVKSGQISKTEIGNIINLDNTLAKIGQSPIIGSKTRYALGYGASASISSTTGTSSGRGGSSGRSTGGSTKSKAPTNYLSAVSASNKIRVPKVTAFKSGNTSPVKSATYKSMPLRKYSSQIGLSKAPTMRIRKGLV